MSENKSAEQTLDLANKIYEALKDKGATIGNASIFIIQNVLEEYRRQSPGEESSAPLQEQDKTKKVKCDCPCHRGMKMQHIVPCCEGGYKTVPISYPEKKDLQEQDKDVHPVDQHELWQEIALIGIPSMKALSIMKDNYFIMRKPPKSINNG